MPPTEHGTTGSDEARVARAVLEWSRVGGLPVRWRPGDTYESCSPMMDHANTVASRVTVGTDGRIAIDFAESARRPPFADEDRRLAFLRRPNEVPGIEPPLDAITRYPAVPFAALVEPGATRPFFAVVDWLRDERTAGTA